MAKSSARQVAISVFVAAAALGLSLFGALAWRAVEVRQTDSAAAIASFEAARAGLPLGPPLLYRNVAGRVIRRSASRSGTSASRLHVLAYHAGIEQLVRADVPLWFLKAKGPAVQYVLRGTSFDMVGLNLTAQELEREGSCIVLDETRDNGDRLLVWTD